MLAPITRARRHGALRARTLRGRASARAGCRAIPDSSAPRRAVLPDGRDLDGAQKLHLGLERDAVLLTGPPPCFGDERNGVCGPRLACVLDEVCVLGRD